MLRGEVERNKGSVGQNSSVGGEVCMMLGNEVERFCVVSQVCFASAESAY